MKPCLGNMIAGCEMGPWQDLGDREWQGWYTRAASGHSYSWTWPIKTGEETLKKCVKEDFQKGALKSKVASWLHKLLVTVPQRNMYALPASPAQTPDMRLHENFSSQTRSYPHSQNKKKKKGYSENNEPKSLELYSSSYILEKRMMRL